MRQDIIGLVAMVGVAAPVIIQVLVLALLALPLPVALSLWHFIEWAGGCGQVIYHADGSQRLGECAVMTWLNE